MQDQSHKAKRSTLCRPATGHWFLAFFITLFSFFPSEDASAQNERDPLEITLGVEGRALVPISVYTMDPLTLTGSDEFQSTCEYLGGSGFGANIRLKLTKIWNLESGIYYTRRRYGYQVFDPTTGFDGQNEMRSVSYEIPVKGLVYIQMADEWFMNVALGVSADFYASDVEVYVLTHEPTGSYNSRGLRERWLGVAVLGSIGVEWRTDKSGYFYVGGTFHEPFNDIMLTQVNYYRSDLPPVHFQIGTLDGAYFSIDFRYFFPPKKIQRPKVKRTIPDWKNMR